jgi:polar amino acid transport system ATP-binding protein
VTVILGPSGSGKSTLLRTINHLERVDEGFIQIDGDYIGYQQRGNKLYELKEKAILRQRINVGYVFQNFNLFPHLSVLDNLIEAPIAHRQLTKPEAIQRAGELLDIVGLRHKADAWPRHLSGGQQQRIAIARALMLEPALVVADEPVSALDVSVQAQVLNLMADLQRDLNVAYLFISHDLAVVRYLAHEVLVMYLGLVMEQGPKERIFAQPLHPYTQALLAATPALGAERKQRIVLTGELPSPLDPPAGCVFSTRCPHAIDRCRSERPQARPLDGRMVACHLAENFIQSGPVTDPGTLLH